MASLWEHTYGAGKSHQSPSQTKSRLAEKSPACVVFDGVVRSTPTHDENDGDLHISLTPDGINSKTNTNFGLLNSNNYKNGQPVMVAEVICWFPPDYNKYSNFNGHYCDGVDPKPHMPDISKLQQGAHLHITGKWVQDVGYPSSTHAQWNEIHPVQSIEPIH